MLYCIFNAYGFKLCRLCSRLLISAGTTLQPFRPWFCVTMLLWPHCLSPVAGQESECWLLIGWVFVQLLSSHLNSWVFWAGRLQVKINSFPLLFHSYDLFARKKSERSGWRAIKPRKPCLHLKKKLIGLSLERIYQKSEKITSHRDLFSGNTSFSGYLHTDLYRKNLINDNISSEFLDLNM